MEALKYLPTRSSSDKSESPTEFIVGGHGEGRCDPSVFGHEQSTQRVLEIGHFQVAQRGSCSK